MGAIGLYYYRARWFDPRIISFNQPDTLIPDPSNPLDFNRYGYARYNPVRFRDPSGHAVDAGCETVGCEMPKNPPLPPVDDQKNDDTNPNDLLITFPEDGGFCIGNNCSGGDSYKDFWRRTVLPMADDELARIFNPSIDWNKVDKFGLTVDITGILGDIASVFPPEGTTVWAMSEVVEMGTISKNFDDLETGDPSGVILFGLEVTNDALKLIPLGGWVFNLLSIGSNVLPATEFNYSWEE